MATLLAPLAALRPLLLAWLAAQAIVLAGSLAIQPMGWSPQAYLTAGSAIQVLAYPASLVVMPLTEVGLQVAGVQSFAAWNLATWAACFLAGLAQLWFVGYLLVRRERARARAEAEAEGAAKV